MNHAQGTFTEVVKSKACSPCPMGTFYNRFGAGSKLNCTQCSKGTYNDKTGSISIDQCTKSQNLSWSIFRRMRLISPLLPLLPFLLQLKGAEHEQSMSRSGAVQGRSKAGVGQEHQQGSFIARVSGALCHKEAKVTVHLNNRFLSI